MRNQPSSGEIFPFHNFDEDMSELDLIFSIVLPFAEIGFIFVIFGLVNIDSSVSSIFSLDLVVDHFLLMNV